MRTLRGRFGIREVRSHPRCPVLLMLLVIVANAWGLDPGRSIDEFFHTAWNISDGAPSGITQIMQTSDGYLWLATQTGLVRFDGISFDRYEPTNQEIPANTVASLLATADGGLWIGLVPHGAAFLKQGKLVAYDERDGLPLAPVFALGRDPDGAIWAGTSRGVFRFDGRRWQAPGRDWGLPQVAAERFVSDNRGRLWVSTLDGLFFLPPHQRRFQLYLDQAGEIAQSQNLLWIAAGGRVRGIAADTARPVGDANAAQIELSANGLLVDRDNTLWILTHEDGIERVSNPDSLRGKTALTSSVLQHFTQEQGLTDDRVTYAFEDREGNVWISTRGGLDRFRPGNLVPGPFPYGSGGQDLALVAAEDGSIWAGNLGQPLMRFLGNGVSFSGENRDVTCAFRDTDGSLWFGGDNLLLHDVKGKIQKVALPHEIDPRLRWGVQSIVRGLDGGLWISVTENGVFRLQDGVWTQWGGLEALPRRTAVTLWADPGGRIWFGFTVNEIAVLEGTGIRDYSAADGLDIGTIAAFAGSSNYVWVGGERGLAGFDGRRFHMLATTIEGGFRGVSGIVETEDGGLWINQANGLVHISRTEVQEWLHNNHHELRAEIFDYRDGFPGSASPIRPLPSAVLARDGRIWVSGTSGTAWIDPAHIYRNSLSPPVAIESILVDDRNYLSSAPVKLPALPSDIEIAYTALSLSVPERVRFRYQLEGYDKEWQEADTRRSAFYTKLGPGHYRFHVIACNNDGVWNETGAAVEFAVPPAWFQTYGFLALCVLSALGILWLLYLLRLRQVGGQMQARLRERLAERERIARELHDTLLQGIQALVLRFQAAANQIAPGSAARTAMDQALNSADQVIVEGRKRVTDLRAGVEPPHALTEALRAAGEELAGDRPGTAFRVSVHGTARELHTLAYEEAYWIGREALLNSFYHAGARNVRAALHYGSTELQLQVVDDGRGIDVRILDDGGIPGHWGLRGMQERAEKIGAQLRIASRRTGGTAVTVKIPAAAAYRPAAGGWRARWRRTAAR